MPPPIQSTNRLLQALSHQDLALLVPNLARVELKIRDPIEQPNKIIPSVYFVESGIISVVACATRDRRIEAGLVGYEGVTGLAVLLGDDRSPHQTYVQIAGGGMRIATQHLQEALTASPSLSRVLMRYAQCFMVQTAHTALANGTAKIEERLARWLLMAQDRSTGDELELTHEFMAIMLGVRRPGVTDTLHALEGRGLIKATRGLVRILDREGLEDVADGSYGVPEAEYARLLG